jgi:hypothetical protein
MKNKLGFLKRIGILAVLMFCLGFVMFAPSASQSALARPCCSQCPIDPFDPFAPEPSDYCTDQCGASSGSCYNSCINSVYNCWHWCDFGC